MDLLPISPSVVLFLVADYQAATNDTFLEAIAPSTFSRLHTWPPPTVSVNGVTQLQLEPARDPYTMILEIDHTILVRF